MADLLALERHDPMDNAIWLLEYVAQVGVNGVDVCIVEPETISNYI